MAYRDRASIDAQVAAFKSEVTDLNEMRERMGDRVVIPLRTVADGSQDVPLTSTPPPEYEEFRNAIVEREQDR